MKFSIVIPTYKEKKNLPKLIISLTKALKNQKINYEIIFIDDESNDGSYEVYNKNKTSKTRFIIRKEKPRDLSKSVVYGFKKSKYDNLIVMDGDLQHHPLDLKSMIRQFKKNDCDILIGSRNMINYKKVNLSPLRFYVSKLLNLITNFLFGLSLKDPMSVFFIIRKNILKFSEKKLLLIGDKILLDIVICSPKTDRIKEFLINFKSRDKGFSKMRLRIIFQLILFLTYRFFFR